MMEPPSPLREPTSQYVDGHGKLRILVYRDIAVTVSPSYPRDLPLIEKKDVPRVKSYSSLMGFVNSHERKLRGTAISGDDIVGVYLDDGSYIPVNMTNEKLRSLKRVQGLPPMLLGMSEQKSKLQEYRRRKDTAHVLKEYAYFTASRNRGHLAKKDFVVDPDHSYNLRAIGSSLTPNSEYIYQGDKMIVRSKQVRDSLLYLVDALRLSDEKKLMSYSERHVIESEVKVDPAPDEIVLVGRDALVSWLLTKQVDSDTIVSWFIPTAKLPYYFLYGDHIYLVQNVFEGTYDRAYNVAQMWSASHENPGYYAQEAELKHDIDIFSVTSLPDRLPDVSILEYVNNQYAACLLYR